MRNRLGIRRAMIFDILKKLYLWPVGVMVVSLFLATAVVIAGEHERAILVLTSTNDATNNRVVVFRLDTDDTPSLSLAGTLPTGGKGGASTNGGILQFKDDLGAVANWGSNNVSQLVRKGDLVAIGRTISLASGCANPDSVALAQDHLFVVGTNCAESHKWPSGEVDERVVSLSDPSAAQIAVGENWSAVTFTSGSILQLPMTLGGELNGTATIIPLPGNASNTPLGAAFWRNILGFTPAHSFDSFAIVNEKADVFPIVGPTPPFPTNAPCWVAKGPGSVWYTSNSPGHAISIFFSDDEGGVFYKSVPLPGVPTDLTVAPDRKWLAVIYTANGQAYVAVFAIDGFGGLAPVATSSAVGAAAFNGVAISE